jgi:hypothetical protein
MTRIPSVRKARGDTIATPFRHLHQISPFQDLRNRAMSLESFKGLISKSPVEFPIISRPIATDVGRTDFLRRPSAGGLPSLVPPVPKIPFWHLTGGSARSSSEYSQSSDYNKQSSLNVSTANAHVNEGLEEPRSTFNEEMKGEKTRSGNSPNIWRHRRQAHSPLTGEPDSVSFFLPVPVTDGLSAEFRTANPEFNVREPLELNPKVVTANSTEKQLSASGHEAASCAGQENSELNALIEKLYALDSFIFEDDVQSLRRSGTE